MILSFINLKQFLKIISGFPFFIPIRFPFRSLATPTTQ